MKTYTIIYAEDVPHYGVREIEAPDDKAAIAMAISIDPGVMSAYTLDPDYNHTQRRRVVTIDGPEGTIAVDIELDSCEACGYKPGEKASAR
jgi:hypothetical protein